MPPPRKRNWLPWVLGCGCGLVIVLAVVVFGAIGFFSKQAARRASVTTDTTVAVPDTGSYSKPGDDASSTETTGSTEKPSDKPNDSGEPDERGLKEIRPVTGDSTF